MRLTIVLLLLPSIGLSQLVKDITSAKLAEAYIVANLKHNEAKYDGFEIHTDSAGSDTFKQGDFNHDGFTDLLIQGVGKFKMDQSMIERSEVIILLGGKSRMRRAKFPFEYFVNWFTYIVPKVKIVSLDGKDYVQFEYFTDDKDESKKELRKEVVYVKNDRLIPVNQEPSTKVMNTIGLKTNYCYGTCPVFELWINSKGDAEYNGIDHVKQKGSVNLKMSKEDLDYLGTLIANLRIEDLKDNYAYHSTDLQTGLLNVTFKDGSNKRIEDYGMVGTFGLSILFDFLFELREF